ncbi:hypothetical protein Tco_0597523 [Tanacetum coccineum]
MTTCTIPEFVLHHENEGYLLLNRCVGSLSTYISAKGEYLPVGTISDQSSLKFYPSVPSLKTRLGVIIFSWTVYLFVLRTMSCLGSVFWFLIALDFATEQYIVFWSYGIASLILAKHEGFNFERISLESDEILQVHGERTQGVVKTLMNTKVGELKLSDLVPRATPVVKSPYHLAHLEMQELSEQLQELQDEEEHGVHLKLELELLRKEKLYAKVVVACRKEIETKTRKSNVHDYPIKVKTSICYFNERSMVENAPAEMLRDLDQQMEKRADDGCKAHVVIDALRRKERVKPRRVRAMAMTIQHGVRGMILASQSEAFKKENETTDKVVLVKENPKAVRDRQKSYVDYRRKSLEFEVGDRVLLRVSPWKGVVCFGKNDKLAPRYVGPLEILERVGPVAYRLRLLEELSGVDDTFHVSNLKTMSGGC